MATRQSTPIANRTAASHTAKYAGRKSVANALKPTETQFQRTVIEMAKILGWRIAHVRAARTEHGWRTPYEGHSGLPDLILARRGRVILAELKVGDNKPTLDQQAWLSAAGTSGHLWFPADMDEIKATLQ